MEELVHLSNHSRQWVVKGYAPFELLPRELKNSNKLKVGRNDPCYCGSGKKYKKCCLDKDNKLPMGV
jgi:preprotein translocase subunit SecA